MPVEIPANVPRPHELTAQVGYRAKKTGSLRFSCMGTSEILIPDFAMTGEILILCRCKSDYSAME
jgi:hypothetical protein